MSCLCAERHVVFVFAQILRKFATNAAQFSLNFNLPLKIIAGAYFSRARASVWRAHTTSEHVVCSKMKARVDNVIGETKQKNRK